MPDCERKKWSGSPFCIEHLVEAVNSALGNSERADFWLGLERILKGVTYREREIIKLRYGFSDGYSYTLNEVAHIFKSTPDEIRAIESGAVTKLHQPSFVAAFETLCKSFFEANDFGKLASSIPGVLLQTVVIPGKRANDGQIVEAIAVPWFMIAKLIEKNPAVIYQIDPRKWEELIAGWYRAAGFDEVILTPRSGDFGRDVIATKTGLLTVRVIDQVKAYNPEHLVPANDVRALLGVLQADRCATKGFVTTTSDFAPMITHDPFISPFMPYRLELINRPKLLTRLQEVVNQKLIKPKCDFT